jgi:hypothetical protein
MLENLIPSGLTGAARNLGVEPLEVVRLMVMTDTVSDGFNCNADHLQKLAAYGQIETGWWDGAELPEDDNATRQRVRAAIGLLLGRCSGGQTIRLDNLWRGLPVEEQELVEEAMNILADEERVQIGNHTSGVRIGVPPDQEDGLKAIANGKAESEGLAELYQD